MNVAQVPTHIHARNHHDWLEDRLEWHFQNWVRWMKRSDSGELTLPSSSQIIGISHGADFDQLADMSEAGSAEAFNGCFESVCKMSQAALLTEYLGDAWPCPNTSLNGALAFARIDIKRVMGQRGVV